MNQAVIALHDMQYDLADQQKYIQDQEASILLASAIQHLATAELQLRRATKLEDGTHERLFDQEVDISDYEPLSAAERHDQAESARYEAFQAYGQEG